MMPREIMPVIEGERPRRSGLSRVMHEKPSWQDHAYAHTLGDVKVKEFRSISGGGVAIKEINRLRSLHGHAHGDLSGIYSEVKRAEKDITRLLRTKIKIPDKAERIAKYQAIIDGAPARIAAAKAKVHETNSAMRVSDRSLHLIL